MTDLAPWLAPAVGFLLQQLRAFKWFPESAYTLVAMLAGGLCLWLYAAEPFWTRAYWQTHLGLLVTFVLAVVGGTAVAAKGSTVVNASFVPPTNSRGN